MSGPNLYNRAFDDLNQAIGRVAAQYSDLEFHISEIMWLLMNVERQIGACVTAQMIGPGPRFRALLSLLALRNASREVIDDARNLKDRVGRISAKRNRVVHDPWGRRPDGSFHRIHLTADHKLDFSFKTETISDLDLLYDEITEAKLDWVRFRDRLERELPDWSRRQFYDSPGIRTYLSDFRNQPSEGSEEDS